MQPPAAPAPTRNRRYQPIITERVYLLLRSLDVDQGKSWGTKVGVRCSGCRVQLEAGDYFEGCVFQTGNLNLCDDCAHRIATGYAFKHSGVPLPPQSEIGVLDNLPLSLRIQIYTRDRFTCRYCGAPGGALSIDHIIPGKNHQPWNLATACRSCNSRKGHRTPDQAAMPLLEEPTARG